MNFVRQYKVGIYDTEQAYMLGLMQYINADVGNPVLAIAFSTEKKLEEYLQEQSLDLLVLDEEIHIPTSFQKENVLFLATEEPFWTGRYCTDSEKNKVYKYTQAEQILKKILMILGADANQLRKKVFSTYGVISPIGRCGKTRLAKAICENDELRGALYLGMEAYGTFDHMESNKNDVMSNLLYLAKNRSFDLIPYLEKRLIYEDGIYMVPSASSYLDLQNLTREDVVWMLEEFINWGKFSTIVCDIGGSVLGDLSVLEAFDHLIMPVLSDEDSEVKISRFMELLKRKELGKLATQIQRVQLPDVEYNEPAMMAYLERVLKE